MNELRNRVWYLLIDVKTNHLFCIYVSNFYKKLILASQIFLLFVTILGMYSWFNAESLKFISVLIVVVSQILTFLLPYLKFEVQMKAYEDKAAEIAFILADVEEFWEELYFSKICTDSAIDKFIELQRKNTSLSILVNIIGYKYRYQQRRAENETNQYASKK